MKRLVGLVILVWLLAVPVGRASPLNDFSAGRAAVDLSWKPCTYVGSNAFDYGVTAGLGSGWAVAYRQMDYDTAGLHGDYRAKNQEVNLIRKVSDGLQLFAGYSRTAGGVKKGGPALVDKNVAQIGAIATRNLSDALTLYAIIGGGRNVTNIEVGLSYRLSPCLELTSTYRHLTVEKVGSAGVKENFRGFGLGITMKF